MAGIEATPKSQKRIQMGIKRKDNTHTHSHNVNPNILFCKLYNLLFVFFVVWLFLDDTAGS